jgi:hypothetical protein
MDEEDIIAMYYDSEGNVTPIKRGTLSAYAEDNLRAEWAYSDVNAILNRRRRNPFKRLLDKILDKVFGPEYPLYR